MKRKNTGAPGAGTSRDVESEGLGLAVILDQVRLVTGRALKGSDRIYLVLSLVWGLTGALGALVQREFLDRVVTVPGSGFGPAFLAAMGWLGVLLLIQAGELVRQGLEDRKVAVLWKRVALECEDALLTKASEMEFRHYGRQDLVNRLVRANNEFASRMQKVVSGLFRVLTGVVTSLGVVVVLGLAHWAFPLMLLASSLPAALLYRLQTEESYRGAVHATGSTRRVWYFLTLLTTRGGMKEIRFGGLHDYLVGRHDACADEVAAIRARVCRRFAAGGIIGEVLRHGGFLGVLWLAVDLILQGQASVGTFALVLGAGTTLQTAMLQASNGLADIRDSGRYFRDWLEVMAVSDEGCRHPREPLDLSGAIAPGTVASPDLEGAGKAARLDGTVECQDLWFTYPGNGEPTLRGISLRVEEGERIAIVGENGSGKSTFISLLCGLYAPDRGTMTIGGYGTAAFRDHTRRVVSAALQEFQRYDIDVLSNVRLGNAFREVSEEEAAKAAELLGIDGMIRGLAKGWHTPMGNQQEGGVWLSGGEWQKLVLARSLVKPEARVMVLDEPTASLDPPAEAALYKSYGAITGDRTSILVSHRLGACKLADRILVFHRGRIIEEGSHRDLMALKGKYHAMFEAQAAWYR